MIRLHHRARARTRGFTLIELTLSMAMVAMLALSMYTALSVAQQARRNGTANVEQMRAITLAAEVLRHDFESVPPPTGTFAGPFVGIRQGGVGGDADQLEFFTIGQDEPLNVNNPMSEGIRKVQLLVRSDVTPPVLVRRVIKNLRPTVEPLAEEEVICRNVRSFSVKYFDGLAWQETWDSTTLGDVLPMSVAVTLELDDPTAVASGATPEASVRRMTRVFPLSCGKPVDPLSAMGGME
jgi:type II secretion system protein J